MFDIGVALWDDWDIEAKVNVDTIENARLNRISLIS